MNPTDTDVRIDKWLWAARFFKTRGLAVDAIDAGHVRRAASGGMVGDRVKPSLIVKRNDSFAIQRGGMQQVVVVTALSERRGSASDAALLYRETDESKTKREEQDAVRKANFAASSAPILRGRPTKQDRRRLADFFASNYQDHQES
ncbi:MAG: RNA-binding S4 domain-containing protein [Casimicrobium sp.]